MDNNKNVIILGIETSCDETSAAVLVNGTDLKSHIISSQIGTHQKYGGVVPEIASREHCLHISQVVSEALGQAGMGFKDLSAVAVTYGPGLVGSLLVGVSAAKAMAYAAGIPLIGVNHLEGHVYANFLEHPDLRFPLLALLASGGHTNLIIFRGHLDYEVIGRTRDDAAGEAFDKVARALGFGYPGGPNIQKAAFEGNAAAFDFPRAMLETGSFDFSFSGLKSSVLNTLNSARMKGEILNTANLAASFQAAVVEVLVQKTLRALEKYPIKTLALAGGVAANSNLRQVLQQELDHRAISFVYPSPVYCTDNGAMIALAGYYRFMNDDYASWKLNAVPGLNM
ncbi:MULTISPECIES: tRNA (adenosine(37)-N6)-threonylcarbamoyltransferase complex transferase subunit TsaD [unclassified Dehalobacter]|uniref:tRNA (adenosine(37)-N6)-threonylcarbamoyltransferase complex transferase subunit TsaD n=1 Tax=unclassified Dehalobacter TaxID=2635733 RepID=UPI00037DC982|nr:MULTISPECIES: tRNA (adenosine(37)-N6)-threonylcarbamoyltransferase complex transferase subunit TsaD [unclassified Dehalobacter]RJE48842.1 tRNA N6-adenosine(37)-threonylcarbamoyltransferase complex transferase subunit TsaD [Dehalobacter sp. MCB1]TCX52004.1 tRNA (adenosine(37)-N6)-threonylcarbamoyltransferase complex transferase subunit TsaD [Dehalobacter sp. 14DCB1]TCX53078.1 tRNA (adenosine(37)-N6)-threonylcarbamoyltransferase complex transferase subunit TsaD [Dehalobacter sp. 12DCB1]